MHCSPAARIQASMPCVELGNTGSRTTIHRYLKEIEEAEAPICALREPSERFSAELTNLVSRLLERMTQESGAAITDAQAVFDPVSYTHLTLPTIYSV